MTKPTRPATSPQGKTILAFVLGLTLGLVIAAAIAMFVTRAPVPFVDRGILSNQNTERLPAAAPAPRLQPLAPEPVAESAPTPKPPTTSDDSKEDKRPTVPSVANPSGQGPKPQTASPPSAASQFFLQVAAFKSADEAEQMRVRLAFMGFEAHILETKKDDTIFFRVRLGPYRNFEELNRAKTSLSQNGLEATVVRLNP